MKRWGLVGVMLLTAACQEMATKPKSEAPKFELQGFAISYEEKKESYGRTVSSTSVKYKGRGNLVLVSPSPPDGHHYEVWLRLKTTCGKDTDEELQLVIVMNGIGMVQTYCGGYKSSGGGESVGELPQQPPT